MQTRIILSALFAAVLPTNSWSARAMTSMKPGQIKPDGNMDRSKIPDAYKWDLTPLFASDAAFAKGLTKASANQKKIATFKGKLSEARQLRRCLDLYFETRLLTNKLTLYASMRFDSAEKSTVLQAMRDKSLHALKELMSVSSFIRQEILGLSDRKMRAAYTKEKKLAGYEPYIEEIRRRRSRVLNAEAERVLSLAGDNLWAEIDLNEIPSDFEKIFGALITDIPLPTIKDEKGKEVQLTLSNYGKYRGSKDRRVRKDAVKKFFGALKQYRNALAASFAGQARFNVTLARSRGYDSALEAYLNKDNIDPKVYTNLISTIRANVKPLHEYVELRKQVMGLDSLHIYDLYTPLVPDVEMEVPYEEAARILPAALAPLGADYVEVLEKGLDPKNGWIDIYPHKDKGSGAFSSSVYGVHPFVKMNYYDGFDDLSTLAHEYGHAIHSYLAGKKQPYITFNYSSFIAEIASTTNEKLLSDYLLKNAKNDDERLAILNGRAESIRTTIYRQTLFAEFELRAHEAVEKGTPLTAKFLNDTYRQLIADYYGKGFSIGENDDIEWAYVPHFYFKFYMMSYATGLSSGIALADLVQKGGDRARGAYLAMLAGGSSKPPLDLLRGAGVDLTKPAAIEAATRLFAETVEEMRRLVSKKKS